MPETMELLETLNAQDAAFGRLYDGLGGFNRAGGFRGIMEHEDDKSFQESRRLHEARVDFIHEMYLDALDGNSRALYRFQEAMTASDFPLLFGDVIDRVLLAGYAEIMPTYMNYIHVNKSVKDFRNVSRYTIDGAQGLLPEVAEMEEYPAVALKDGRYQYRVKKHGNRVPFSWETLINDDLGAFSDIPQRFGRQCRRSEEHYAATLFMDANGPHASLYTSGNKNIVNKANGCNNDNPPIAATEDLIDAIALLGQKVDKDGQPIEVDAVHLVVSTKAQEIRANQLVNTTEYRKSDSKGNVEIISGNGLGCNLHVWRNPYIAQVASGANGLTSWALFADPTLARPACEMGFLRGHDQPEMFRKTPNAMLVGGNGQADPAQGDFDTDSIQFKVRHCFGGGQMDPVPTVASNGSSAP